MGKVTIWHGSDVALRNLQDAVSRNCTCPEDLKTTCPGHQLLLDQTILDHFVFVDIKRMTYVDKEFDITAEWFG